MRLLKDLKFRARSAAAEMRPQWRVQGGAVADGAVRCGDGRRGAARCDC